MPGGSHSSSIRHRGGDRLHPVGAAVAAVLAVLAGILLVNLLNGPSDPGSEDGARQAPSAPAVPVPAATEPDEERPSASPEPTRSAAPSPSASPKPSPSPRSAPADPPPDDAGRAPRVFAPVVVLNNSRIGGLADTAAERVEAAGFTVERVGNYVSQYNVPVTTVFYDPEDAEAARTLLETVPGIERMVPREETRIIETDTLILVVTRDFPAGDQP